VTGSDAEVFERCMGVGGIAVFPADTVYGLACDAQNRIAVERLYRFKRRSLDKPSAVMFFDRSLALAALPELGPRTREALKRLFPGPVTTLVPNPLGRFPLACGADPATLGVRVPMVPALDGVRWPVLQSSANLAGAPDARRLDEIPEPIRRAVDLIVDGGELPGTPSTVVDLRAYEDDTTWSVVRPGGMEIQDVAAALERQFHFDPSTYGGMIRAEIPDYERLQEELAVASGAEASRILDLGTGTGETARRLLERHPDARLVGVDESESMLAAAQARLPVERVELHVSRLEDELPEGPFDLVASALGIHHLRAPEKRDLFARIRAALTSGGRFVLGDVVVPVDPGDGVVPLAAGYDHPDSLSDQVGWLTEVGFETRVTWKHRDLAVVVAQAPG
jgi:L-threonylcarbamoyladenylate synthase